jgi:hypothetical protein
MARLITPGRIAFLIVGGLVLAGVLYYLSDPPLAADVEDKQCGIGGGALVVETRLFGIRHTAPVDMMECGVVPLGAYVVYHVRSKHTIVYETEGGRCIWDSARLC